jgi:hypothetical protein
VEGTTFPTGFIGAPGRDFIGIFNRLSNPCSNLR